MGHGIVGFVLNLISLIHGSFATVVSVIVIGIIIYHQYHNHLRREEKITLILSANIYFYMNLYVVVLVSCNIQTLLGDIYEKNFDSSWCTFRGYLITVACCTLFNAFAIQAFYRLCRIVYSNHRWVQFYWLYVIAIPVQLVEAIIILCPILIWHDVIYLPNEHYCFVPFTNTRGILWALLIAYGVPLLLLSLIYLRITIFIRQQPLNQTLMVKQRQKRDLAAIQRIFINVGLLFVLGIPGVTLLIMCFITGIEHPLTYRITWAGPEVSFAISSIQMVFMTPQLKNLIIIRRRQNPCLTAANIHHVYLANNHTLDFGVEGLEKTCETLDKSGISYVGAGRTRQQALGLVFLDVPISDSATVEKVKPVPMNASAPRSSSSLTIGLLSTLDSFISSSCSL
ncbi:unnamed protein product [Rotaria sordida]|uniref:Capsule synthesis protein CapA domain-containing protein n=1 Tax=Rotaria sordida TaxID=392033 RepID=A0A819A201_9BILA|nr:unnamed protein product [Rotaria sordida]